MGFKKLETKFLGRKIIYHKKIDSTQSEIFIIIEKGKIKNGTVVIADIQTNGKGTHGRTWRTDEKNNIAFSFYINTDCDIKDLEGLTTEIAKIIVDIFKTKYKIKVNIKKPNDLIINNKKVGGILTQTKTLNEKVKYIVIGIGINTNKENFTDDIKNIATSIKNEFGIEVDREEFITEFCNQFEKEILGVR